MWKLLCCEWKFPDGASIMRTGEAFDVDEGARTVIDHVQAGLIPSWVGTDLMRTY
jgi:hypothetical protein